MIMIEYNDLIENHFNIGQLSPFQFDILKHINYFNDTKGVYYYNKTATEKQFEGSLTPEEIKADINDLIERNWILKENKKVLFNGRYSTRTILTCI